MSNPVHEDVVITGIGVVSPIGIGRESFWGALIEGKSGVRDVPPGSLGDYPIRLGGTLSDFDPKAFIKPRKAIKLMSREIQTGYVAAKLAVQDAALEIEAVDSSRFGVVMGSQMLYGKPEELIAVIANSTIDNEFDLCRFGNRISHDMFPLWMLNYLPNMPACHVGIAQDAQGPNNSIVQGDASALLAMIEAASLIRRGWCDVMIAGGVGNRLNLTHLVHVSPEALTACPDPASACRPFDAKRDGEVLGEGAGAFILESAEHARRRGASPLAKIVSHGSSIGAVNHLYHGANVEAIQRSIRSAMQSGNLKAEDIDHVNAHGASIRAWDVREAIAIRAELGDVPVMAPRSYFGGLGSGTGAVEAAATILAFAFDRVPGTLNHEKTDPECDIRVIPAEGKPLERNSALLLNQSTTGQTVAMTVAQP